MSIAMISTCSERTLREIIVFIGWIKQENVASKWLNGNDFSNIPTQNDSISLLKVL